jgi:hypothetical protein
VPDVVAPIIDAMSSYPAHWALCGGWAVDAWLGRHTREHGDVDISVFVQDQRVLLEHLRGWQLVPHDVHVPDRNEVWAGRHLDLPGHLHGRPDTGEPVAPTGALMPDEGFSLDIQLDDCEGSQWFLSRDPLITVPIDDAVAPSPWGVPAVAPEVLLFFKARNLRRRDKLDFATVLPRLSGEKRAWLRDAIGRMGHPWLAELS